MRKLFSSGLVVFAGVVSAPMAVSVVQSLHTAPPDYRHDPRLASLRTFFSKMDCPAVRFAHVFLQAADRYDLDWRLLPSISFVESTGGKSARHNNIFGWNSGRTAFPSVSAGIHTVGYNLANSERYKDKDVDEILATYNPNVEYAQKVKWVMRRISPD